MVLKTLPFNSQTTRKLASKIFRNNGAIANANADTRNANGSTTLQSSDRNVLFVGQIVSSRGFLHCCSHIYRLTKIKQSRGRDGRITSESALRWCLRRGVFSLLCFLQFLQTPFLFRSEGSTPSRRGHFSSEGRQFGFECRRAGGGRGITNGVHNVLCSRRELDSRGVRRVKRIHFENKKEEQGELDTIGA